MEEDFPQNKVSQIKMDAAGKGAGEARTHLGTLLGFWPLTIWRGLQARRRGQAQGGSAMVPQQSKKKELQLHRENQPRCLYRAPADRVPQHHNHSLHQKQ
jgi:hypothetical protein